MRTTKKNLRKIIAEIVQVPVPDRRTGVVHKVEEEVTEEMLDDMISVLPLWQAGEHEQVEALLQDMHSLGRKQVHDYMNEAEELKVYGQMTGNVPDWVSDYFYNKFYESTGVNEMRISKKQLKRIIKEEYSRLKNTKVINKRIEFMEFK